jgi:hypothetical protein
MIGLLFLLFSSTSLNAKVLNLKDSKLAGYLSFQQLNSIVKKDFFEGESSATDFSKGFTAQTGTDFGLVYRAQYIAWVFGFEFMKSNKISNATASTGGTNNYNYTSEVSYLAPKVGLEIIFYQSASSRVSIQGAVGTASLTSKTDYSNLSIAPNANFSYQGKGAAHLLNVSAASELSLIDNTAIQFTLGYRNLNFEKIKSAEDVAASFQGALVKGSRLQKLDGSNVEYDFSGLYLNVAFRIWIF